MFIAIIKLFEVLARSLFILVTSFSLPLEAAGKFGIIVTIISIISFAISWERYIDLQRSTVVEDRALFGRSIKEVIQFFVFNYLFFLPIFILILVIWLDLKWQIISLCVLILIGEQVTHQSYLLAVINKSYKAFLWILLVRSIVLLLSVLLLIQFNRSDIIDINYITSIWAAVSVVSVILISTVLKFKTVFCNHSDPFSFKRRIFTQHKASLVHFLIGLLSVVALQIDRLAVGTLLSFTDVGVYFRNVMLASFLLQFINIACYNRIMPVLLALGKQGEHQKQIRYAFKELINVLTVCILCGITLLAMDELTTWELFERYSLSWFLIVPLFCAVFVRTFGDFCALILHSRHREKLVLAVQATSVCAGAVLLAFFAPQYQAFGVALAALSIAVFYASGIIIFLKFLPTKSKEYD